MHLPPIRRTVAAFATALALIGAAGCSPGSNGDTATTATTTTTTAPAISPEMIEWTDLAVEVLHGDESPIDADAITEAAATGGPVAVIELLTRPPAGSEAARRHIEPLGDGETMTDRAHQITGELGVDDPSDDVIEQVVSKADDDTVELTATLLLLVSPTGTHTTP